MADPTDAARPDPITGTEFPPSTAKAVIYLLLGVVVTVGAGLIVAWRLGLVEFGDRQPKPLYSLAAGAFVLIGLASVVIAVLFLVRRRGLVVGADRFQIVEYRGGSPAVVCQVMYENVADVIPVNDAGRKSVRIRLAARSAEGTYDAAGAIKSRSGPELVIHNTYRGPMDELANALIEAVAGWQAEAGPDGGGRR